MIYLDNAATTFPKPESVYRTIDEAHRKRGINPGRGAYRQAIELSRLMSEARATVARFLGAKNPSRIVFVYSATDGLNIALKTTLNPGDHVISTTAEHNAVVRPLHALAKERGVRVSFVRCDSEGLIDPKAIRQEIGPKTRMIAMTHASNVTGTIQPIEEVARIAKEKNLLFLVDAAQTLGVLPVDVEAMGIDLLAFPGHKGLLGPQGIGGLYVREGLELRTWREGGTGSKSESADQPEEFPEHLEAGTGNTSGILALRAGIEFLQEKGLKQVAHHERELLGRLIEGIAGAKKIRIYGPKDPQRSVSTLSFNIDGFEPAEVGAILDQNFDIACRTGLHCAPLIHESIGSGKGGTVRLSPGLFNTNSEIDTAIKALKEIAS